MDNKSKVYKLYQSGFKKLGKSYQRLYPNEEFCRFMGRNFFRYNFNLRKKIKILEVGVGSGGNLSMVAAEGFQAYGLDFSKDSIKICKNIFREKKLKAKFEVGDMKSMPYKSDYFDCVFDVFSSCLMTKNDGKTFLNEVSRVLKIKGKFFSYFPSKKSKLFKSKKKVLFDKDTIIKLYGKDCVFDTINTPLRFMHKKQYISNLIKADLKAYYAEEITKTYFDGKDSFTFNVIEATN